MADEPVIVHGSTADSIGTICGRLLRDLHQFEAATGYYLDVNCGRCLRHIVAALAALDDACEGSEPR